MTQTIQDFINQENEMFDKEFVHKEPWIGADGKEYERHSVSFCCGAEDCGYGDHDKDVIQLKSFHLSSMYRLLDRVVGDMPKERVIYDNWACTHDRDEERWTKLTKEEKSYNQALKEVKNILNTYITQLK